MSSRVVAACATYFSHIVNQINVCSKPLSLVKQTGSIPGGFPYSAFNGGAKVRPEALLNAVEASRLTVLNKTPQSPVSFLDSDILNKDYFMFIVASLLRVDHKIYDISLCKAPLYFDVELENIGKTSMRLRTKFYLEDSSNPVITSLITTVLVCNKHRVIKPPPIWWVDKYQNAIDTQAKSMGMLDFVGGDETQCTESRFRILPSDCDPYWHTNWTNYIRYCHDAIGYHLVTTRGDLGYQQFFGMALKDLAVVYKNESSVGNEIIVKVCPAVKEIISSTTSLSSSIPTSSSTILSSSFNNRSYEIDENSFCLVIESGSKILCKSKMEYHPVVE